MRQRQCSTSVLHGSNSPEPSSRNVATSPPRGACRRAGLRASPRTRRAPAAAGSDGGPCVHAYRRARPARAARRRAGAPGGHHDRAESEDRAQRPPDRIQERHEAERRADPPPGEQRADARARRPYDQPSDHEGHGRLTDEPQQAQAKQHRQPEREADDRRRRNDGDDRDAHREQHVPSPPTRTAPSALPRPCARRRAAQAAAGAAPTSRIEIAIASADEQGTEHLGRPREREADVAPDRPGTCAPSAMDQVAARHARRPSPGRLRAAGSGRAARSRRHRPARRS